MMGESHTQGELTRKLLAGGRRGGEWGDGEGEWGNGEGEWG